MFKDEFQAVASAAQAKVGVLKNKPLAYFVLSMLAGAFVGFAVIVAFSIGGMMSGNPMSKIVMGMAFGSALSFVVMAGSELFTGNNFVMTAGIAHKKIRVSDAIKLWIVCWLGNLVGSLILAFIFVQTGLYSNATLEAMNAAAQTKASLAIVPMISRGILCNIMVCLATWCSIKMKSESGKLIMIFWCLFVFFTAGYEHSVANMTLFGIVGMNAAGGISLAGMISNLIFVTLGNMIGGIIFVGLPYHIISK